MIKNKIINVTGQPVTGKDTTIEEIRQDLTKQGYVAHIISTGHEFREYFNAIFDFIKSCKDLEQIVDFKENKYVNNFLEKKEYRDALIETIIEVKNRGIHVDELNIENANNLKEFREVRKIIDTIIDTRTEAKIREFNSIERPNEVLIVNARVAGIISNNKTPNEPPVFSVRLISDPQVAAERLFNDKRRGKEDSKYASVEEAYEAREKRRIGEQERYIKRYGIDLEDEDNYNLIIDTSYSTPEDIADTILTCLDRYLNGKDFNKNWNSKDSEER